MEKKFPIQLHDILSNTQEIFNKRYEKMFLHLDKKGNKYLNLDSGRHLDPDKAEKKPYRDHTFKVCGGKKIEGITFKILVQVMKFYINVPKIPIIIKNEKENPKENTIGFKLENKIKEIEKELSDTKAERINCSDPMRDAVWENHSAKINDYCYCCGKETSRGNFECGHILPVARGGKNVLVNFKAICHDCNSDMSSTHMYEYIYIKDLPSKKEIPELLHKYYKELIINKNLCTKVLEGYLKDNKIDISLYNKIITYMNPRNTLPETRHRLYNYISSL